MVELAPKQNIQKAEYFEKLAFSHIPEMRLLFRGGKLTSSDGWRNVAEHCLVQVAVARQLGEILNLSERNLSSLEKVAACHDWEKRLNRKSQEFTPEEKARAKEFLSAVNPDENLMTATGVEFIRMALVDGESTFMQRLQFYIDDIVAGTDVVNFDDRIDEVEARRQDLNEDADLTQRLGGKYWDRERELGHIVEREIFGRLPLRIQEEIGEASSLSSYIKGLIEKNYLKEKTFNYSASIFTREQPNSRGRANEDAWVVLENDEKLVAFIADGATELSTITTARKEILGGAWSANAAREEVDEFYAICSSAKTLLLSANDGIAARLMEKGVDLENTDPEYLPTAAGTLVMIDKRRNILEVAQLGDTLCLLVYKDGSVEPAILPAPVPEDEMALVVAIQFAKERKISLKEAIRDSAVGKLLAAGRATENRPDGKGYGALNGKDTAEIYLQSRTVPLNKIKSVILLTDGMIPPQQDFPGEPVWEQIVEAISEKGLEGFYQKVYKAKESDPELLRFPRFKQHDDATGIVINITSV
jgi:serine/threonine protein phosphatase PrpC